MRFTAAFASLSLLSFAFAQDNSTDNTSAQVVTIEVGGTADEAGGIFQFKPNNVTGVQNGTVINFRFTGMPGNHSITQSTFADPCTPMEGGFDSGWVFLPTAGLSPVPEWNLTVTNTTTPIWFFCKQLIPLPHCNAGMVGAINPPDSGDNTFANYQDNARNASVDQTVNGLVGHGASASARPAPVPSGGALFPDDASAGGNGTSGDSGGSSSGNSAALGLSSSLSSAALLLTVGLTTLLVA